MLTVHPCPLRPQMPYSKDKGVGAGADHFVCRGWLHYSILTNSM